MKFLKKILDFAEVFINGTSYKGKNIRIVNNKTYVDGTLIETDGKQVVITVNGDLNSIEVDNCHVINIKGNVDKVRSTHGDIDIEGFVTGDVKTVQGDIEIGGSVGGNVETTQGDVECGKVTGNVKTINGDIETR